jgi:hypothetical protein
VSDIIPYSDASLSPAISPGLPMIPAVNPVDDLSLEIEHIPAFDSQPIFEIERTIGIPSMSNAAMALELTGKLVNHLSGMNDPLNDNDFDSLCFEALDTEQDYVDLTWDASNLNSLDNNFGI